ncbi:MAG: hypothetical protein ACI4NU_11055, partial [Christensenellales bacterium]
ETARWISLRASEDAAPYTHIISESTDVGDGLWTSRALPLSVSAARCHLSRGERQEHSNAGTEVCLGSPFGGAVIEDD